jgi:hypothetical protein
MALFDRLRASSTRRWNQRKYQEQVAKDLADLCHAECKGDPLASRRMFVEKAEMAGLDPMTILLLLQLIWKFYQWTKKDNTTEEPLEMTDVPPSDTDADADDEDDDDTDEDHENPQPEKKKRTSRRKKAAE